jgi:hypothetical protein
MSETELVSLFDINIKEFLSNLKTSFPNHKKRIDALESELEINIVDYSSEYNKGVKKYEKRFLSRDITVIRKIVNPIFAKLNMHKVMTDPKLKSGDLDKIWDYLLSLYMYTELTYNSKRSDLSDLVSKCTPKKANNDIDDVDNKIKEATEVLGNIFGGDSAGFKDLISQVGKQVGIQLKQNGGDIDTIKVMESFNKMMKGEDVSGKIGGLDMKSIIDSTSKNLEKQIENGTINPEELKKIFDDKLNLKKF